MASVDPVVAVVIPTEGLEEADTTAEVSLASTGHEAATEDRHGQAETMTGEVETPRGQSSPPTDEMGANTSHANYNAAIITPFLCP